MMLNTVHKVLYRHAFESLVGQDLLYEIRWVHTRIRKQGATVIFIWVPAHAGIIGNERADKLARQAVKNKKT